jgi:hypothetical protein
VDVVFNTAWDWRAPGCTSHPATMDLNLCNPNDESYRKIASGHADERVQNLTQVNESHYISFRALKMIFSCVLNVKAGLGE